MATTVAAIVAEMLQRRLHRVCIDAQHGKLVESGVYMRRNGILEIRDFAGVAGSSTFSTSDAANRTSASAAAQPTSVAYTRLTTKQGSHVISELCRVYTLAPWTAPLYMLHARGSSFSQILGFLVTHPIIPAI